MIFWKLCCVFLFAVVYLQCAAKPFPAEELTPAAQKLLAEIAGMLNDTIDPCDDFYGYVCSNVKTSLSRETKNENSEKYISYSQQPTDGTAINQYFKFLKDCRAKVPHDPHYNHTSKVLDHIMDSVDEFTSPANLVSPKMLAQLAAHTFIHDYDFLMPIIVINSAKNAEFVEMHNNIISIRLPLLSNRLLDYDSRFFNLTKENIVDQFTTADNKRLKSARPISNDINDDNYTVNDMIELERKIAEVFLNNENEISVDMTVRAAMERMPQFDWRHYILTLEKLTGTSLTQNCKLENCPIQFRSPYAITEYLKLISNMKENDFVAYVLTRVVMRLQSDPLITNDNKIHCDYLTEKTFPLLTQYFKIVGMHTAKEREEIKRSASKLADNVIASARTTIDNVPWIRNQPETYAGFIEKLEKLKKVIAYPDHLFNQTWLDEQYKDFDLKCRENCADTFAHYINARKYMSKKRFETVFYGNIDFSRPRAFFLPIMNTLFVTFGKLSPPAYNPDYIPALKYGGTGSIIGHEIFHDFDATRILYDADGILRKWMSDYSEMKFNSMAQCVTAEHSHFELEDKDGKVFNIDGRRTLDENIADLGGIQTAYDAFKNDPAARKPISMPELKGLTNEQLFFVSFARNFCQKKTPVDDVIARLDDVHSPHKFRVLGVLRNFVPFREAFKCPVNSNYAPAKHCKVYN